VSQQTTNRSFDDLARAMAEGSLSRRGALKLFAGSAIAALIPSRALGQEFIGNSSPLARVAQSADLGWG
jgi:hypothetical protein